MPSSGSYVFDDAHYLMRGGVLLALPATFSRQRKSGRPQPLRCLSGFVDLGLTDTIDDTAGEGIAGGVRLTFDPGDALTLEGIALAALNRRDFLIEGKIVFEFSNLLT